MPAPGARDDAIAIDCRHAAKAFQLYVRRNDQLLQALFGWWKTFYKEHWVLRDINFQVKRGECVGIVGRNGAGLMPIRGHSGVQGGAEMGAYATAYPGGVTIDISRRRVHIDGESAALTFKEFELLQYLVLREGRTIERTELVSSLWSHADADEAPGERTIDVHVRRLRAKLGRYEDVVRTVRGIGYRLQAR